MRYRSPIQEVNRHWPTRIIMLVRKWLKEVFSCFCYWWFGVWRGCNPLLNCLSFLCWWTRTGYSISTEYNTSVLVRMVVGWGTILQAGRSRDQSRWGGFFQFTESFQSHYGPRVDSAFNRNEYQESSWGVKGGRRVGLTTLPLSVSRLSRQNVGASMSHNPMGFHSLLQGWLYLYWCRFWGLC
jgi:hypothetical protein